MFVLLSAGNLATTEALFSESNTRFLVETTAEAADSFERLFQEAGLPVYRLGTIVDQPTLAIQREGSPVMEVDVTEARAAWQKPLDW